MISFQRGREVRDRSDTQSNIQNLQRARYSRRACSYARACMIFVVQNVPKYVINTLQPWVDFRRFRKYSMISVYYEIHLSSVSNGWKSPPFLVISPPHLLHGNLFFSTTYSPTGGSHGVIDLIVF